MQPALWLIVLPVGAAPLVYLFRRVGVGAMVAAVVTLFSTWLASRAPIGLVLQVLGRPIELDRLSQVTLSLLFGATTILFLISSASVPFIAGIRRKTVDSGVLTGAGRTFYPLSLGILGLLVAASLSRHLGITAIFVEVAAILAVFIIQGSRLESIRAAQRFLVLISLSIPLFLLVSRQLDRYPLTETAQTALFVGIGFALWLAVVPFHSWSTATASEASPASAVFILIVFPAVALLTLTQLLVDAPWLVNSSQLAWAILIAGGVTALVGGLLTSVQRGFSGLIGYAALYDLGYLLVILGLGGPAAVMTIFVGLIVRALALTLIAGSVSALRLQAPNDGFAQMSGLGQSMPLAMVGALIGGLTLAGAPLTIGFALRWQMLQAIAEYDSGWSILLVLAGIGVVIGYLRGFWTLLPQRTASQTDRFDWLRSQEPFVLVVVITGLGLACLILGLYPKLLIEPLLTLLADIRLPI